MKKLTHCRQILNKSLLFSKQTLIPGTFLSRKASRLFSASNAFLLGIAFCPTTPSATSTQSPARRSRLNSNTKPWKNSPMNLHYLVSTKKIGRVISYWKGRHLSNFGFKWRSLEYEYFCTPKSATWSGALWSTNTFVLQRVPLETSSGALMSTKWFVLERAPLEHLG